MASLYTFHVFEGTSRSRTVVIPELTRDNSESWLDTVYHTLEVLKLDHFVKNILLRPSNHVQADKWVSDRYEAWRIIAIPAWEFYCDINFDNGLEDRRNPYYIMEAIRSETENGSTNRRARGNIYLNRF